MFCDLFKLSEDCSFYIGLSLRGFCSARPWGWMCSQSVASQRKSLRSVAESTLIAPNALKLFLISFLLSKKFKLFDVLASIVAVFCCNMETFYICRCLLCKRFCKLCVQRGFFYLARSQSGRAPKVVPSLS